RVSLFDLPEEVQKEFGFDPFVAMDHAKATMESQREIRWKLFWERQQYESEQAKLAEQDAIQRAAEREWIPVEATVIQKLGADAVLARCERVTFEKTTTKSTLGFTIDGPPRRVLVKYGEAPLVLRFAVPLERFPSVGQVWKGYVNPVAIGEVEFKFRGVGQKSAAHQAAPAK
ncbi:MAG: hypothetical protein KDM63_21295, partial [Verrucomicrobiae bacterium]|nr:hypothetical protein [Verrucomicrobiae bacterium]